MTTIYETRHVRKTAVKTTEVICLKTTVGTGTAEDPVREQEEYFTKDGKYIGILPECLQADNKYVK